MTTKTLILRFGLKLEGLQSAQALAISPSGEIFIGDHNRGSLFQAKRGDRQPLKIINNGAFRTFWSLAIANDEKSLFVSSGTALGGVYQVSLPLDNNPPNLVWRSTPFRKWNGLRNSGKLEEQ